MTNGIIYSVSQQKVFGPCHAVKNEIYQKIYGMDPDKLYDDEFSNSSFFSKTSAKLVGHTATGLRAIVIESSKSEYQIIRLCDIRISAKSYIRVGPYYPKPILEQRIIGSIFEHERI